MRLQVLRALASHDVAQINHAAEATSVLARNRGLLPRVENDEVSVRPTDQTLTCKTLHVRADGRGTPLAATNEILGGRRLQAA
jgi:hypothetical protein